ncbi:MAG: RnfH family protein [Gammaproteobacteria bacterium]|nr:RnfH family protein [Gammaproteobacteria bacterium]
MEKKMLTIEVVYQQTLLTLTVPAPCTAEQAIQASGILQQHPEIDLPKQVMGVFGEKITLDTLLKENDRLELYLPLLHDPKQARKQRAK